MWRNADVLDFVGWLRAHNERARGPVGFYGLDLYSLYRSIEAVIGYLDTVDPSAAERARRRYACFERFEESQAYGYAVARRLRALPPRGRAPAGRTRRAPRATTSAATASRPRTSSSTPSRTRGWC